MRIGQLAPLVECVPPVGYGGTELVVSLLTEELVSRGHEVTLFATGDSVTKARLVPVIDSGLRRSGVKSTRWNAYDLRSLIKIKDMQDQFDIIHNHMGFQALPFLDALKIPVVTTNHNLVSDYCKEIYLEYGHMPFVSISDSYRLLNYPDKLNYVATVYNGIDIERYKNTKDTKREYLLFIGRISKAKGTADAIDIALKLKMPIKVAGKVDSSDQAYFDKEITSRLDAEYVHFIGEVNEDEKVALYQGAIATVYPIDFDEPFGLVMAESMAAGTPVMAFDRGSVKELIVDGHTGIIGNTVDDLVNRFGEIRKMKAETCERRAREMFGKEAMADGYEKVYLDKLKNQLHTMPFSANENQAKMQKGSSAYVASK